MLKELTHARKFDILEQVIQLLDKYPYDEINYTTVVAALAKSGKIDQMHQFLTEMKKKNYITNPFLYGK